MLRADRRWRTCGAQARERLREGFVASSHHIAGRLRALIDKHGFDRVAAAHSQAVINYRLQRQLFATPHLVIGSDHRDRPGVDDALLQRFGREAAEYHAVGGPNARAGLHGNHAFKRHRHVDQHAVALLNAICFERVGKLADLAQQFFVRRLGDGAVISLEDNRCFIFNGRTDVFVQAVG